MRVIKVEYIAEYKLKILFSDNKTKIVDLKEKIKNAKGVFLPLKDLDYFKTVSVDDCHLSICWPNGADICPDVLYDMGKDLEATKRIQGTRSRRKRPTAGLRNNRRHKSHALKRV